MNDLCLGNLKSLSSEQLKRRAPNELLASLMVPIRNEEKNPKIVVEAFELWSRKLLNHFQLNDFNLDKFNEFLSKVHDKFTEIIRTITKWIQQHLKSTLILEHCDIITIYLKEFIYFTKYVLRVKETIDQEYVKKALDFTSNTLQCIYRILFPSFTHFPELSKFEDVNLLTVQLLEIFISFFNDVNSNTDLHFDKYGHKYIKDLCELCTRISSYDLKSTTKVWKCILNVLLKNSDFIKLNNRCQLLVEPITILSNNISESLTLIYGKQELNEEHFKEVEIIIKVNSFYMKILHKFAQEFSHNYFPAFKEVFNIGRLLFSIPLRVKKSEKVYELIKQNLTFHYLQTTGFIYGNTEFIDFFTNSHNYTPENTPCIFALLMEIFSQITDNEQGIIELNLEKSKSKILSTLFESVSRNRIILNENNYRQLINVGRNLILKNTTNKDYVALIEDILTRGIQCIFRSDSLYANISLEMWLMYARLIDSNTKYKYFLYWFNYLSHFPIYSNEIEATYSRYLTKSLFNLLDYDYKIKFWNDCGKSSNCQQVLLITIDIDEIPNNIKKVLISNAITNVEKLFYPDYDSDNGNHESNTNDEKYKELMISLKIINSFKSYDLNDLKNLSQIYKYIMEYVINNFKTLGSELDRKCLPLRKILLEFIYNYHSSGKIPISENINEQLIGILFNDNDHLDNSLKIKLLRIISLSNSNEKIIQFINSSNNDNDKRLLKTYLLQLNSHDSLKVTLNRNNIEMVIENILSNRRDLHRSIDIKRFSYGEVEDSQQNSKLFMEIEDNENIINQLENTLQDVNHLWNFFDCSRTPNPNEMALINEIHWKLTQMRNNYEIR